MWSRRRPTRTESRERKPAGRTSEVTCYAAIPRYSRNPDQLTAAMVASAAPGGFRRRRNIALPKRESDESAPITAVLADSLRFVERRERPKLGRRRFPTEDRSHSTACGLAPSVMRSRGHVFAQPNRRLDPPARQRSGVGRRRAPELPDQASPQPRPSRRTRAPL